jgi:high-affinity iron transporter
MFATILIVFRESLEAALLVGVVAAATRGLAGRGRWLSAGVVAGFIGAVILALLAGQLSGWLDGLGQDVVNIGVLSLALTMLLWHCVWVASHTREMVTEARDLGQSVQQGRRTPWALLLVVSLAVLREGAETVLFVSGSLTGAADSQPGMILLAGTSGVLLGALVGIVIYAGLSRVPTRHVFSVTNVLIALLAASLGSQLVRSLTQAGFLQAWTSPMWDSSKVLSQESPLGTLMHALVGYDARPSAAQLSAYVAVLGFIYIGSRLMNSRPRAGPQSA